MRSSAIVHVAVGGVIGFALVYKGPSAVIWAGRTDSFPYLTGVNYARQLRSNQA